MTSFAAIHSYINTFTIIRNRILQTCVSHCSFKEGYPNEFLSNPRVEQVALPWPVEAKAFELGILFAAPFTNNRMGYPSIHG